MKVQMISSVWCNGKNYSYNEILTSLTVDEKVLKMFLKANLAKPLDDILEKPENYTEKVNEVPEEVINSQEVNEEEVIKPKTKRTPRKRVI